MSEQVKIPKDAKLMNIEKLVPYAKNARTHSPEQVEQIAASMLEYGFTNPILMDEKGGILAGHGRVMAANSLGLKKVPVVTLEHLTEEQKRAYIIADNKLALNAGWDHELLAEELKELQNHKFDLALTGFTEEEIKKYLPDTTPTDLPTLSSGDRKPFQQITFTLHDDQAAIVHQALAGAMDMGPFVDSQNENRNGNALARVCEMFLGQNRPEVDEDE